MIISDRYKFVFLHNPKCAGTSVRKTLSDYDDRYSFYWGFDTHLNKKIDKAHMPLYLFKTYRHNDFKLLSEYTCFMFTRHPLKRFISSYNEIKKNRYDAFVNNEISDDEYVDGVNDFVSNMTQDRVMGKEIYFRHFTKQTLFSSLANKNYLDVVIKLEDMQHGISKLNFFNSTVASSLKENILHKNKKILPKSLSYQEILTQRSIDQLNDLYMDDFLMFDY
ncbi:sulfotransferase family 2 domain-containing protein [Cobetia marina]|uniref:sulfotransferase family 2 domain-containing protein n=1 Tax=Cobetia marina TaxID=28258 RepID=UPI002548630E|nr:sulfotransferase family 2 domain-containing protein [Cobetia pacifica]MDI6004293.1 sulfotransferase family 2 domain-containing protein [Cobetia pacifica]